MILATFEDIQGVIEDFTRAIDLHLDYALAYCNWGLCYEKIGEYEKASEDMSKTALESQELFD